MLTPQQGNRFVNTYAAHGATACYAGVGELERQAMFSRRRAVITDSCSRASWNHDSLLPHQDYLSQIPPTGVLLIILSWECAVAARGGV